jgi:hypothetical protein
MDRRKLLETIISSSFVAISTGCLDDQNLEGELNNTSANKKHPEMNNTSNDRKERKWMQELFVKTPYGGKNRPTTPFNNCS